MFGRRPAATLAYLDHGRVACPRRAGDQDAEACLGCPDAVEVTPGEVRCTGWAAKPADLAPSEIPIYSAAFLR